MQHYLRYSRAINKAQTRIIKTRCYKEDAIKIKTVAILLLLLLLTTTSYPSLAKADMGPKPFVEITITFDGLSSGEYYATLLSKSKSTGPFSADYIIGEEPDEIDEVFSSYTDKDGFYYLHYYHEICVFLIEAVVYSVVLTVLAKRANVKPRRIFVHVIYAFVANLASFGLGVAYLALIGI